MCKFMFEDIITIRAFKTFFKMGKEFDPNFLYEVSFGLMPRCFKPTPDDRYIFEEEIDVTEIYFLLKGTFGVAFNSFN